MYIFSNYSIWGTCVHFSSFSQSNHEQASKKWRKVQRFSLLRSGIRVNHGNEAIAFYFTVSIFTVLIHSVRLKRKQEPAASTHRHIAFFLTSRDFFCLHLTMQFQVLDTCLMHYYRLGFKNFLFIYLQHPFCCGDV